MVRRKETKAKVLIVLLLLAAAALSAYRVATQRVDVIYFRSNGCIMVNRSDAVVEEVSREFGGRVSVTTVEVSLDEDVENSEVTTRMMERYGIHGVPTILVNGVGSGVDDVKINICRNFIIRPGACG